MSRNSSRVGDGKDLTMSSQDLTRARDPKKKKVEADSKGKPSQAERDALKADILRMRGGKDDKRKAEESSDEEAELVNTMGSNFKAVIGK